MSKPTALQRALEKIDYEILVLQLARQKLVDQQVLQPKRKPRRITKPTSDTINDAER